MERCIQTLDLLGAPTLKCMKRWVPDLREGPWCSELSDVHFVREAMKVEVPMMDYPNLDPQTLLESSGFVVIFVCQFRDILSFHGEKVLSSL